MFSCQFNGCTANNTKLEIAILSPLGWLLKMQLEPLEQGLNRHKVTLLLPGSGQQSTDRHLAVNGECGSHQLFQVDLCSYNVSAAYALPGW